MTTRNPIATALVSAALLGVGAGLSACGGKKTDEDKKTAGVETARAVSVTRVQTRPLGGGFKASGQLIPREEAAVHARGEFATVRTGRASPSLVEKLIVHAYGQDMPLQQLAGFQVPEARLLLITPYDKSNIGPIEKAIQGLLDEALALRVERTRRFVEQKDRRVTQQGAGDGDALPLAAGKPHAALAEVCAVTLRQTLDKLSRRRRLGGAPHVFLRRPGAPITDVLHDVGGEDRHVLGDHGETLTHRRR